MVATIGYRQDLTLLGYGINVATYQLDVQAGGGSVMVSAFCWNSKGLLMKWMFVVRCDLLQNIWHLFMFTMFLSDEHFSLCARDTKLIPLATSVASTLARFQPTENLWNMLISLTKNTTHIPRMRLIEIPSQFSGVFV